MPSKMKKNQRRSNNSLNNSRRRKQQQSKDLQKMQRETKTMNKNRKAAKRD